MITLLDFLVSIAAWLFKTSLKASVLVALILIIQLVFRRKLSARWQYGLWLLLIIRLILPFDIESRFSLFNLMPAQNTQLLQATNPAEAISTPNIELTNFNVPATSAQIETEVPPAQQNFNLSTKEILALVWLLGLIAILLYTFICNFKLWRKIRLQSSSSSPLLYQLLEQCKKQMKITRPLALIEMEGIRIPVLFGIFKPKILLPVNFTQKMTADQIKHILLHELAHYKRNDVLVSCLTTILQISYWFNPIIWFAFYRMRSDRELACDEMTLNRIGAAQSQAYGQTIISLLETMTIKFRLPVTVSIIETKKDLKRRLAMIVNFKQRPLIWSIVAIIVLIAVGGFALTDARVKSQQTNSPASQLSNLSDDEIQNIDSLQYQVFDQQVEQEINSSSGQAGASENHQQNVSEKSAQHDKIQKPYRSEIIITFTSDGVKVDGETINVDSLLPKLNTFRFDDQSIITLKPEQMVDHNDWFNIQMQLQMIKIKRLKYVNAKTGKTIITKQYNFERTHRIVNPELIPKQINGKYGYSDRKFQIVIEPKFDEVGLFQEDLAPVRIEKKWGFINKKGDVRIEPEFQQARPFDEGLAAVMVNNLWGFIDKSGKIVIEPAFESVTSFHEELALVTFKGKRGFIRKGGQFAIPPTYDNAREFSEGLAAVKLNDKWGFVDYNGNIVIAYQFDEVDRFTDGLALVRLNGKYGYIDKKGNFVINPQFEHAESFSEGLAAVRINGKYGYIDKRGAVVIEPQYDHASNFMGGLAHVIIFEKPELNIKGQGFEIDKAGNVIGKIQ